MPAPKIFNRLMRWLDIPHVTLFLVMGEIGAFVLALALPEETRGQSVGRLLLQMRDVYHGEAWRLVTFLIVPPTNYDVYTVFWLIGLWFFYFMGNALEAHWGRPKYNLYLLTGYVATVIAAVCMPDVTIPALGITGAVFLAFAYLYPDFTIYIFFVIPIKIKWVAAMTWVGYTLAMIFGWWWLRGMVLASTANFLIFFGPELISRSRLVIRGKVREGKLAAEADQPFHVCRICGVTDKSDREMDFRYCPQCKGSPCYCANHIHAHEHIV